MENQPTFMICQTNGQKFLQEMYPERHLLLHPRLGQSHSEDICLVALLRTLSMVRLSLCNLRLRYWEPHIWAKAGWGSRYTLLFLVQLRTTLQKRVDMKAL